MPMFWMHPAAGDCEFRHLQQQVREKPAVFLTCEAVVTKDTQREYLLRLAWSSAIESDMQAAAKLLPRAIDHPWAGDVRLPAAMKLAGMLKSELGDRLLAAAVRNSPGAALREYYLKQEIVTGAMLRAPDDAVAIASGASAIGARLLRWMEEGSAAHQVLAALAKQRGTSLFVRQRAAAFAQEIGEGRMSLEEALRVSASNTDYFSRLIELRLKAGADTAGDVDRLLEQFSMFVCRELREGGLAGWKGELDRLSLRDTYLLIAYGRGELDRGLFQAMFDGLIRPRLAKAKFTPSIRFREFYADAVEYGRANALDPQLAAAVVQGFDKEARPVEASSLAADTIDMLREPKRLAILSAALQSEWKRTENSESKALYGLLAIVLSPRLPKDRALAAMATKYAAYWKQPKRIQVSGLFSKDGTSVQRYYFYDDKDGVKSYASFLASYRGAAGWRIKPGEGWVRLEGRRGKRRILIIANTPIDLTGNMNREQEAAARHRAADEALAALGRQPDVVVHRGHTYHLDRTISELTNHTQLVFLGACRGTGFVERVMNRATTAQMIATRGTGDLTVNDPLLRSLNDRLLDTPDSLDWDAFWRAQGQRMKGNSLWQEYIPPHRNTQAMLLHAWYEFLATGAD